MRRQPATWEVAECESPRSATADCSCRCDIGGVGGFASATMKFTKMHGLGNDYVYVNCFDEQVTDAPGLARAVTACASGASVLAPDAAFRLLAE